MKIIGCAVAVPQKEIQITSFYSTWGIKAVDNVVENTGVTKWRVAKANQCVSDLAYAAADNLLQAVDIDRNKVDAVIYITQTPDFLIPTTAPFLQRDLKLKEDILSFDINQGCSGYTDGLILANALLNGAKCENILLIAGDTLSKIVNPQDKGTALLFGDAVSATLLSKGSEVFDFVAGRDGEGSTFIHQRLGYRNGLHNVTANNLFLNLDGAEIFSFTLKRVPAMIKNVLENVEWKIDDVDFFIFHQANRFIINYLANKIKIPQEKVPMSLHDFGNTSSASIPLTMITTLENIFFPNSATKKIVLAGYGVGLSWSSVALEIEETFLHPLIEI